MNHQNHTFAAWPRRFKTAVKRSVNRLCIIVYHRVHAVRDDVWCADVTADVFEAQLIFLKKFFNVVALSEAVKGLRDGNLPPRSVSVTFDDGYRDNFEVAYPILRRHELKATFFVAAGYLGNGRMWNDSVIEALKRYVGDTLDLTDLGLGRFIMILQGFRYRPFVEREQFARRVANRCGAPLPNNLMMDRSQVQQLYLNGMEIGAHTLRHPLLKVISDEQAWSEVVSGKEILEDIICDRVDWFAYPHGFPTRDFTRVHVEMVRQAGYAGAVTTSWGSVSYGSDYFQLPRIPLWSNRKLSWASHLTRNNFREPALTK
jgi:peptidoglycan/xylan/chitin deacetylase (PgdA/CDA1 family)